MKLKNLIIDEYEQAFPYEQEYTDWIASMENDLAAGKLVVTDQTKVLLQKDNIEERGYYIGLDR
jgi:predicted homoserine dehydrogenase-like protein